MRSHLYPPSPPATTATDTATSAAYLARVALVVLALTAFAALYLMLIAFLLKELFKRSGFKRDRLIAVDETDQPDLFAFVDQLCRETNSRRPNGIFITHEVNAAVFSRTNVLSFFQRPAGQVHHLSPIARDARSLALSGEGARRRRRRRPCVNPVLVPAMVVAIVGLGGFGCGGQLRGSPSDGGGDATPVPPVPPTPPVGEVDATDTCPRGLPSTGQPVCEYDVLGPNQPRAGTISIMKLRVETANGTVALCLRPRCANHRGTEAIATATADAGHTVTTRFDLNDQRPPTWTLELALGLGEDGSYMPIPSTDTCPLWGATAGEPLPGATYPPYVRNWRCDGLTARSGAVFGITGCVFCTGWDK